MSLPEPVFATRAEGYAGWEPNTCDPTEKPGAVALRRMVLDALGGRDLGITRKCSGLAKSHHNSGRAWDWGINAADPVQNMKAREFLGWLLATRDGQPHAYARRLGVHHVIYDGRIWTSGGKEWGAYLGKNPHRDHVHTALSTRGAAKLTSFWSGASRPASSGAALAVLGAVPIVILLVMLWPQRS